MPNQKPGFHHSHYTKDTRSVSYIIMDALLLVDEANFLLHLVVLTLQMLSSCFKSAIIFAVLLLLL